MELKEDMTGEILLVFDPKTVKALARVLTGMEIADITEMDEFTSSMMKEIGNIMCGSYITALAGFTNLFINPEPPELIVDMISAIISEISIPLALAGEENILLVETLIEIEGLEEALQGYLLLVPSVDSLEKLLKALGM